MGYLSEPKTFMIGYGDISPIRYPNGLIDNTKVELILRDVDVHPGLMVGEIFWYILPNTNTRTTAYIIEIKEAKVSDDNKDTYDEVKIVASIVRTARLNKITEIDVFRMSDAYEYENMCALFFEGNLDRMFELEIGKPVSLTKEAEDMLSLKYNMFMLNGVQYNLCIKELMPEGSRIILDAFIDTFETDGNGYHYHVKKMCIYGYRHGLPIPSTNVFNDIRMHARSIGKV